MAYRSGCNGKDVEATVKQYKSHRRIFSINSQLNKCGHVCTYVYIYSLLSHTCSMKVHQVHLTQPVPLAGNHPSVCSSAIHFKGCVGCEYIVHVHVCVNTYGLYCCIMVYCGQYMYMYTPWCSMLSIVHVPIYRIHAQRFVKWPVLVYKDAFPRRNNFWFPPRLQPSIQNQLKYRLHPSTLIKMHDNPILVLDLPPRFH